MAKLTLGIDPGTTLADSDATGVYPDGRIRLCGKLQIRHLAEMVIVENHNWFVTEIEAVVVEWPYTIAGKGGKDIDNAIRTATVIADRLHCLGVPVYTPTRVKILAQLGRKVKDTTNKDKWLAQYLEGIGYQVGPGTVLKNTHRRAALGCALFNWRDPRNDAVRYDPDGEVK